jgi:multiple sugar transport system substrate-binding protein
LKYVLTGILGVLVLLSFLAYSISPRHAADGKPNLVWTVDNNKTRQEQVDLFNRMYPQYRLTVDDSNRDISKVIVQSIGGVGPDLFESKTGFALSACVNAGIALDLTDEIRKLGVDVERDLWNGANPCLVYDGRVYGLPNNVAVDALWMNKDHFREAGVSLPAGPMTWDEFIPVAEKLMVRNGEGKVVRFGFLFAWWQWRMFMVQWGGRVYSADGTRCEIDCPETVAAIQFMQDLVYRHRISPSPEQEAAMTSQGGWGTGTISWFGGGRASTSLGGRWWLMALRQYEGLRLGVVESPHGPNRVFHSYGRATLINRKSPHRREALDFMRFILSREYNELLNHQGDGLGPVKKYSFTDKYLNDPDYPAEDYNAVWRDVMELAAPEQTSLFANGGIADLIINAQLDLVKTNHKSAANAMRDAAKAINENIRLNISRDPKLRARYESLVAGKRAGK